MQNIISIMGPTASGKTDLAIQLAQQFNTFCVSVDSAMVYRGMDIGTAKPSAAEMQGVEHKLIDVRDPADVYSVGDFLQDANSIISCNKSTPLIFVGGSMLYHHALQYGVAKLPESNPEIRQQLQVFESEFGLEYMYKKLHSVDPAAAEKINNNDRQRIYRALEVFYQAGVPISVLQRETVAPAHNFINIILMPHDRSVLHAKIAQRFHKMLELGFVDEVKALFARDDLNLDLPSMRSIGYRQAWEYLQGELCYDKFCEQSIIATRQFAKRQCTWLRRWDNALQVDPASSNLLQTVLEYITRQVK
jgi:tRNA dimethylallyltransferase